jgi:hypothetical protein
LATTAPIAPAATMVTVTSTSWFVRLGGGSGATSSSKLRAMELSEARKKGWSRPSTLAVPAGPGRWLAAS